MNDILTSKSNAEVSLLARYGSRNGSVAGANPGRSSSKTGPNELIGTIAQP